MNQQLSSQTVFAPQDGSVRRSDPGLSQTGACPLPLDELVHELRQPLGVIESLAYYLELTSTDESASVHLKRIQAMVLKVSRILERILVSQPAAGPRSASC